MIAVLGDLDPIGERLIVALPAGVVGRAMHARKFPPGSDVVTFVPSTRTPGGPLEGLRAALGARPVRVLVLSRLGAHPDARHPALRALWALEEQARASGWPTLTLRFGPIVGPGAPLWNRLRTNPALPNGGRKLLNPVLQADALETLERALGGRAAWEGWYEVAGPEVWSLAELRDLAVATGPAGYPLHWEPPLEEMAEHKLAESRPWSEHFGIVPTPIAEGVREPAA